jgi:hypothetical protein
MSRVHVSSQIKLYDGLLTLSDLRNASSAGEVAKKAVELGNGHVDIQRNLRGQDEVNR